MRHHLIGCGALTLALIAGAAGPAVAQDAKAAEILAATRKAIGDKKLDGLKTLSVEANMQRNLGNMQMQSDVEMLLEMPDKYVRRDTSRGGMMTMSMATGFSGDRALTPSNMRVAPGGATMVTFGGSAPAPQGEKPTAEQLEQMNKAALRNARQELSRLMLGWFGSTHPTLKADYSYVGEAESPDGKAYAIDVKDADGFAARLFIDQNSKLPLMVTYQARKPQIMTAGGPGVTRRVAGGGQIQMHQQSGQHANDEDAQKAREKQLEEAQKAAANAPMVEYSLFFEDWREVDGIKFPHIIRRASEGTTSEEWTINKVKLNPKIDAKKFAVDTK